MFGQRSRKRASTAGRMRVAEALAGLGGRTGLGDDNGLAALRDPVTDGRLDGPMLRPSDRHCGSSGLERLARCDFDDLDLGSPGQVGMVIEAVRDVVGQ